MYSKYTATENFNVRCNYRNSKNKIITNSLKSVMITTLIVVVDSVAMTGS